MFIDTKYKIPANLKPMVFKRLEDIDPNSIYAESERGNLKGLQTLDKTPFPAEVKNQIVEAFKKIGVENPLQQKLVEPYAIYFGGHDKDGEYEYSNVNWDKVIDYFEYEAASLSGDAKRAIALQKRANKKYGHEFFHYAVYEDGKY
jgi:hypothetical protein